jgi:hypothetical protein
MTSRLKLAALTLATAAVAAPSAYGVTDEGTLLSKTSRQVVVVKRNSAAVDPLAISMLRARGWKAGRIYDWTQGACSYQVKPASCYLTPAQARLASQRLAQSMGGPRPTSISVVEVSSPGGFDWGDALIGGVVTAGIFLLGAATALLYRRRELTHP